MDGQWSDWSHRTAVVRAGCKFERPGKYKKSCLIISNPVGGQECEV